ncbi:hypothetical protein QWJ34_16300 [Saccharibacillus sp. CPCC 101409]|uniref:hypothetical protein n=1 Tax=Saccharibacillus sp. CPCC 101409 TaxID=3058041 RepID=UPI002673C328|nr:hypothetical protein [Saccharibacillus sp. CPCC 101409]MDO3411328.1 hypothetical protein [Saccharibacillus sp. CPCC 101409]
MIDLKNRILKNLKVIPLSISDFSSVSFLTTDVTLYESVKRGLLNVDDLVALRPNPKSSQYVSLHPDRTTGFHEHVVGTALFIHLCESHEHYRIIF